MNFSGNNNKVNSKFKVGIVTLFYKNYNYGGMLQAYALTKVLNGKFHLNTEVILYDRSYFNLVKHKFTRIPLKEKLSIFKKKVMYKGTIKLNKKIGPKLRLRIKRFDDFANYVPHTNVFNENTIVELKTRYDYIITGSDQVWNPLLWDDIYLLDFVSDSTKKISYAASFGVNKLDENDKNYLNDKLKDFYKISVREESAKALVKDATDRDSLVTLDPTLLLNKSDWLSEFPDIQENRYKNKYAFCYLVGADSDQRKYIYEYCKKRGLKIVNIPHAQGHYKKEDEKFSDYKAYNAGPIEWMNLLYNSDIVFTDSFHGLCFSALFHKDFYVLNRTNTRGEVTTNNDRQYNLLREIECLDKKINSNDELKKLNPKKYDSINWKTVDVKLAHLRQHSIDFLKCAVDYHEIENEDN